MTDTFVENTTNHDEFKNGVMLDEYQRGVVDAIRHQDDVVYCVTGNAGSGKSEVIKYLLRNFSNEYTVCSTTARSALLVNGVTVDKMFCFSRGTWNVWSFDYLSYVMKNTPRNIIIDEASMVGSKMGGLIYELSLQYNKRLLLFGDWAQASPVDDKWPFKTRLFNNLEILRLEGQHRQSDEEYLAALNSIRRGNSSKEAIRFFSSHKTELDDSDTRVRMYATNDAVDYYNAKRFREHLETTHEKPFNMFADVQDCRPINKKQDKPFTMDMFKEAVNAALIADEEPFAKGVRVILTRNNGDAYVNGDTGTLEDAVFDGRLWSTFTDVEKDECLADDVYPDALHICLDRIGRTMVIYPQEVELKDALGKIAFMVKGYTMKLGYAWTVHKSQGMTVDRAWIDLHTIACFPRSSRHGLTYVALSRTRTSQGLALSGSIKRSVFCDPAVSFIL